MLGHGDCVAAMTATYRPQSRMQSFRINKPLLQSIRSEDPWFADPCNGKFDDGIEERQPTAEELAALTRPKGRQNKPRIPKGVKRTHRNSALERYRNP